MWRQIKKKYGPHLAFASVESIAKMCQGPVDEVTRLYLRQWPQNLVNPDVKERYKAKWGKMSD